MGSSREEQGWRLQWGLKDKGSRISADPCHWAVITREMFIQLRGVQEIKWKSLKTGRCTVQLCYQQGVSKAGEQGRSFARFKTSEERSRAVLEICVVGAPFMWRGSIQGLTKAMSQLQRKEAFHRNWSVTLCFAWPQGPQWHKRGPQHWFCSNKCLLSVSVFEE